MVVMQLTVGDFNNDGNLDMVMSHNHYNPNCRLIPQNGRVKEKKLCFFMEMVEETLSTFRDWNLLWIYGNFMFSEVPEMTAFDFDNDGDLDIVSSNVGLYYAGSAWVAYKNVNGKLSLADVNII